MNADQIHDKIYSGRAKIAMRLGKSYDVYRPVRANNPLTNQIATIKAAFNAGDSKYKKPNMPGDPIWFGDFDGRITCVGDYLVNTENKSDIRYIAAQQQLLPIIIVECNRSVRLIRAKNEQSVGYVGYSGVDYAANKNDDILGLAPENNNGKFIGWPCSILLGKGQMKNTEPLPASSSEQTGWQILLPASVPVVVNADDLLIDDLARKYSVSGAEKTDLGWRIKAIEVHQ
jgi:hypothetical protein